MTASRMLVVRLPGKAAGWEDIDSIHEYINRAIVDGVMVLGEGIKLELVELPPLGAVEVVADGEPEPIAPVVVGGPSPAPPTGGSGGNGAGGRSVDVSGSDSTDQAPELPPILPAEGVSRPEPKPTEPPPPRPPAEKPKPAERIDLRFPMPPKAAPQPVPDAGPAFVGQGAIEKRKIHERLTRYWETAGPGAMQRLADQIGWPVANVYGAQRAEKFDMDHWRQLARGMDALGFEEVQDET